MNVEESQLNETRVKLGYVIQTSDIQYLSWNEKL